MVQNKLVYPYVRFEMDIGYGNQIDRILTPIDRNYECAYIKRCEG